MLRQLRSADKLKKILWIGLLLVLVPSLVAFYGFGRGGSMDHGRPIIAATIKYPEGNEGKIGAAELRQAKIFLQEQAVRYAREQQIPLDQQAAGELATEKAVINVQAAYEDWGKTAVTANVAYQLVPGFTITPEVSYTRWDDDHPLRVTKDAFQGMLRFQRSF